LQHITEKIVTLNEDIVNYQQDADGIFQDELNRMKEGSLGAFYDSLHSTLEYYEKFPHLVTISEGTTDQAAQLEELLASIESEVQVDFSGEEIFGKYLDLNEQFHLFCNLMKKNAVEQDYLQYLDRFNSFFYIKDDIKESKTYLSYLLSLWEYLENFYRRVNPLIDLQTIVKEWEGEFQVKVKSGEVKIPDLNSEASANIKREPQPLRLGAFNSPKELEALGMDRLKEGLEALGLKCGGTLQDRAERLWSVRGKKPEEIPAKLKAKPTKGKSEGGSEESDRKIDTNGPTHFEKVSTLQLIFEDI
jgi:splicing factor 3A subunit 3